MPLMMSVMILEVLVPPVGHDGDDADFLLAKVIDCDIYTCAALFGNNGVISEDVVTDGRIIRVRGRRGNLNNAILLINRSCCHTYASEAKCPITPRQCCLCQIRSSVRWWFCFLGSVLVVVLNDFFFSAKGIRTVTRSLLCH